MNEIDPIAEAQMMRDAFALANRAVVSDIETECVRVDLGDGAHWYDTRPMLDPREHCYDVIDMAQQALRYAEAANLVQRHEEQRYLVRIVAPVAG